MSKYSDFMREMVAAAITAPSGGNNQPWEFYVDGDALYVVNDRSRATAPTLDVGERATYAALGAAVENVVVAASGAGRSARVQWLPIADNPLVAARIDIDDSPVNAEDAALSPYIGERLTNRRPGRQQPLLAEQTAALSAAASARGGQLYLCSDKARLDEIGEILGISDAIRMFSSGLHAEMMSELRWNPRETETTRDGIDIATLEISGAQRSMIRMLRRFGVARVMGKLGAGKAFIASNRQALAASSAFAVVTIPGHSLTDYLQGGRAMERVWLTATSLGLAFQPLAALTYLLMRVRFFGGQGLPAETVQILQELLQRMDRVFPEIDREHGHVLYFRLANAEPASMRSLRRPVDAVLRAGKPPD